MGGKAEKYAFSITAAGAALADGRSPEEIALLSASFMQLSDVLSTIAAVRALEKLRDSGDANPKLPDTPDTAAEGKADSDSKGPDKVGTESQEGGVPE